MNIHEFQAKQVFSHFGIPVPKGSMTESRKGAGILAGKILSERPGKPVAVKAQIHAGGRGKAGGIKLVNSAEEAEAEAEALLGKTLVTHQTGPEGKVVSKLLVEESTAIARELYVSMIIDRGQTVPAIIVSEEGGVEIEEVAKKSPEKIQTERIDPVLGLRDFQVRRLNKTLGLVAKELAKQGKELYFSLFQAFMEMDMSLAEMNPLVVTEQGNLVALDAKINFDDNALYRHPEVADLRDTGEEDPLEVEATEHNLSYIKMDGNIGCMVNGAGLAMATMDMIQTVGLSPANFLDVGGGASRETIEAAFRILLKDPKVQGVLINIFGGILRCDVLAQGIVDAGRSLDVKVPMVIRLEGTNVEQGRRILDESGMDFTVAADFKDAADKLKKVMKG